MNVERLDVAQDLSGVVLLIGGEKLAAHQEGQGAAGIEHIAPDAAVQVLAASDLGKNERRLVIGDVRVQHFAAHRL